MVLWRVNAAAQAPTGLFGLGGGGWREGAFLVLTVHGYLHVFSDDKPIKEDATSADDITLSQGEEVLREAAIRASVYVPLATKCMFLRRGKEFTLEVAEAESVGENVQQGGAGDRLRKWIGKAPSVGQLVPRRVHARILDAKEFDEIETSCQEFVRQGQNLRAAGVRMAPETLEQYMVDNSQLRADAPGLEYRLSKKLEDRAGKDVYERWGIVVAGINYDDEWLKVGDRYLPFKIKGIPVVCKV